MKHVAVSGWDFNKLYQNSENVWRSFIASLKEKLIQKMTSVVN
jgi:hypothetical protein